MWKLMTGILAEKMCSHLERENVLPSEQKGCRKGSRGTKDQLHKGPRHTNLVMDGMIHYKKVYDMVPHSWISNVWYYKQCTRLLK